MHAIAHPMVMTDRERELGAIISAYSEVTERLKAAHERLNEEVARLRDELGQKNAELRRRERLAALGQMAAGLAHEIRNPLGGIALYASMLEGQLAEHPGRTAATKISHGVRSLNCLVGEILDFAQEHRLELEVCALGHVLAGVEEGLRPWVEQHQAKVVIHPASEEVNVYCDPPRLRRALLNLLINGVQAAENGKEVHLAAADLTDGRGTDIEVWDNGPGIPTEQIERIFNPFFTTRATGTGLGLAIVHRIVEAHGGVIRAGNRPEGGARFVIRLPPAGGAVPQGVK